MGSFNFEKFTTSRWLVLPDVTKYIQVGQGLLKCVVLSYLNQLVWLEVFEGLRKFPNFCRNLVLRVLNCFADFFDFANNHCIGHWFRLSCMLEDLILVESELLLLDLNLTIKHLALGLQEVKLFLDVCGSLDRVEVRIIRKKKTRYRHRIIDQSFFWNNC